MPKEGRPHPRKQPRVPGELTLEGLKGAFVQCVDFFTRTVALGDGEHRATVCYLLGMARNERLQDYVLKPMMSDRVLADAKIEELPMLLEQKAVYAQSVKRPGDLDEAVLDLISGSCAVVLPGGEVLTIPVPTEEKRSIGEPENEPALKGSRESFVESIRTNTAMLRRHLRAPELRISEHIVGRQSLTAVDVVWLEGIADPAVLRKVRRRLEEMDIDAVEAAGDLEEYLNDTVKSPFTLLPYTQRPDRFCQGLLEGRVGIFADGIPLGWLAPGTIGQFFTTGQDRAYHYLVASALRLVRYGCAVLSVLLPALYIAVVTYHPEAIPARLALSIVAAKQDVPFSTVFEVLILLLSFEVIQEAGLRLPGPIGSTVSILGGLIVGNAAVQAHIVSPAVLIVVAVAGIAGYTQPSQDMGSALRLWRFLLAVLASVGGLFALSGGLAALVWHLAGLESFGVPYLAPFTTGLKAPKGHPSLIRLPLPWMKWREVTPAGMNRRRQK